MNTSRADASASVSRVADFLGREQQRVALLAQLERSLGSGSAPASLLGQLADLGMASTAQRMVRQSLSQPRTQQPATMPPGSTTLGAATATPRPTAARDHLALAQAASGDHGATFAAAQRAALDMQVPQRRQVQARSTVEWATDARGRSVPTGGPAARLLRALGENAKVVAIPGL